ncbi:MAG: argininosuccinate lyase [Candidatus Sungiibacteriota bacterium]|uniref:Argininosuccinate lyase n=1 Tax=Candidatus Sungiibacteriota bacterium TaxID=2750080 RepID=A0A7T5RJZ7_9BACT|nr:MAG: argininosuccinate lyase [Candidatus Sungbacteria bacterium]
MKLWEKGYKLNKQIENFTVGDDYLLDQKLVYYDCLVSIAHAKMLGKVGLLKTKEVQKLVEELKSIIKLDQRGRFKILKEQEDCHTAIENRLVHKLGDLGKKIHTARSRNDQILTTLRLYYKDRLNNCKGLTNELVTAVKKFTKKYGKIKLPGYTHTRKAMPSSISLWGNAFIDSMGDNIKLVDLALRLIDQSPLGTGAGYGVPLRIDRKYSAELLGFETVQKNPIYTQNSRGKFEATFLHALGQVMLDLNKIASDLIIFSMPEFGYFELPKEFCTGSSIMPQKKNPDLLELLRAKYHVVTSYEFQVKSIIGNLISGYHRDLQLTKKPVMEGLEAVTESLSVMALLFKELKVSRENCEKALTQDVFATKEVYGLVRKGVPFREAYNIVAKRYS